MKIQVWYASIVLKLFIWSGHMFFKQRTEFTKDGSPRGVFFYSGQELRKEAYRISDKLKADNDYD